ncbi:transposase, MuDR, MULE transposase domain protein [Tanacetum coccineum]
MEQLNALKDDETRVTLLCVRPERRATTLLKTTSKTRLLMNASLVTNVECEASEETNTQTQEYKVVEDVGEDDDFNSGAWISATNYVISIGGTVTGCLEDINNFLKKGKLDQVVAIVKSCSPNYLGDLNVTMKDFSGAAMILANVSVFTPKLSEHYLNITKKNVVKVFRKDMVSLA